MDILKRKSTQISSKKKQINNNNKKLWPSKLFCTLWLSFGDLLFVFRRPNTGMEPQMMDTQQTNREWSVLKLASSF